MCGLVGIFSEGAERCGPRLLASMRDAIGHRGPDDLGLDIVPGRGIGLGFARLSIIDLTNAGHQPMWNNERSVAVVFNGEIYNFRDVRRQLEASGFHFRSGTDTEVILHGFEKWGESVLDRLTGMFAIAILDLRPVKDHAGPNLLLARDRLGEKPLYYWWDKPSKTLVFASEIKAMTVDPLFRRSVSNAAFQCYLTLGYVPAPYTMFDGVMKLPPAHILKASLGKDPQIQRYWAIPGPGSEAMAPEEARQEVRTLVKESVAGRLVSDVPLGAFLSGGVDSTIVVGLMSRLTDRPVQTFSAAFEVGARSFKYNVDADAAHSVAKRFGAKHTRFTFDAGKRLLPILEKVVCQSDEPHANPTLISTYLLAEKVKEAGVSVVLTGDGSDELFGGYPRYRADWIVDKIARLPATWRQSLPHLPFPAPYRSRITQATQKAQLPALTAGRYLTWWTVFDPDERSRMLTPPYAVEDPASALIQHAIEGAGSQASSQEALMYGDLALWIPEESNMRTDKMTMAHALECRAPFQDHSLVEKVMRMRLVDKVGRSFRPKKLLKESFSYLLPEEIARRPKWGWFSPVHYWVNDYLWKELPDILGYLPETGLFKPGVTGFLEVHPTPVPAKLWALAVFALWHRAYF